MADFGGLDQPSLNSHTLAGNAGLRYFFGSVKPAGRGKKTLSLAELKDGITPYVYAGVTAISEPRSANRRSEYFAPVLGVGANYKGKLFPYYAHQFAEARTGLDLRGSKLGTEVILPLNAKANFYADIALANRRFVAANGTLYQWRYSGRFGLAFKF